jgi:predicted dehydrogenase
MSADRLRVGIMSFAHTHSAAYATILGRRDDVELLTADPDWRDAPEGEVRGAEFATRLGAPYVDSYEELLAWGPDAVIVCSENVRHRPLVELAASAGAHVLCEKPLATSVEDGEAMVAACRDAGVHLMTAYPVRFAPSFVALRELVQRGDLGDVLTATGTNNGKVPRGRSWFTDPDLAGGGALVDHTVHVADLLDDLLGRPVRRVRAVTNQVLHADRPEVRAETGGLVCLSYDGGVEVTIDCSWSQPDHAPVWGGVTLEIVGTRGLASIAPYSDRVRGFDEKARSTAWLPYGPSLDTFMLDAFLDGVRSGVPPQPDGETGLRTVRVVAVAQESVRTGRPVSLPG